MNRFVTPRSAARYTARRLDPQSAAVSRFRINASRCLAPLFAFVLATLLLPASASALDFTILTDPNATLGTTNAYGINNSETVVGEWTSEYGQASSGFTENNGTYTDFPKPVGATVSFPVAINDAGTIVGSFETTTATDGFIYSGGTFTTLSDPNAVNGTYAKGINNAGTVVGYYVGDIVPGDPSTLGLFAFTYSGGSYQTLDVPNSMPGTTAATGINNNGAIVGYFEAANHQYQGFIDNNGSFTTFVAPGSGITTMNQRGTYALGINDAGMVVGYYTDPDGAFHAYRYSNGAFSAFPNPPNGDNGSTFPTAINDLGAIAGFSEISPQNVVHGFTAVPEPGSLALLTVGALGLVALLILSCQRDHRAASCLASIRRIASSSLIRGKSSYLPALALALAGIRLTSIAYGSTYSYTILNASDGQLGNGVLSTDAYGINSSETVVGQFILEGFSQGFTYYNGTYSGFEDPAASGPTWSTSINDAGDVVGHYLNGYPRASTIGFLYDNATYHFTPLNAPGSTNGTFPQGINDSGTIVGYYLDSTVQGGPFTYGAHAFVYSGGTYAPLNVPGSDPGTTVANGINNLGEIVGYFEANTGIYNGFVYENGVYTSFVFPGSVPGTQFVPRGTFAYGINDQGTVVGSYVDAQNVSHAFIYSNGVFTPFDGPPGNADTNTTLYGINDTGALVGVSGDFGFIAVPEPFSLGLLGAGGLGLFVLVARCGRARLVFGRDERGNPFGQLRQRNLANKQSFLC